MTKNFVGPSEARIEILPQVGAYIRNSINFAVLDVAKSWRKIVSLLWLSLAAVKRRKCNCKLFTLCNTLSYNWSLHALPAVLNRAQNSLCTVITDLDTSKRSTQSLFLLRRPLGNWPRGPAVSMRSELLVAYEKLWQLPLLTVYVVPG
jgi:hypothetical protein